MSYARIGKDSAVYVYGSLDGNNEKIYNCACCRLLPRNDWFSDYKTRSLKQLKRHLKKHQSIGQKIPDHTWERIESELEEEK